MALVSLAAPMIWPGLGSASNSGLTVSAGPTLDAAGEYLAYVFQARESMLISHIGFRAGTSAGSPTIEVRVETVDAAGLPSGTLWATNTNGTTGTISSNTDVLQALTAAASISAGQFFAIKIAYASGTSQIISVLSSCNSLLAGASPYKVTNTGTPTKGGITTESAIIAVGSSATTFYQLPAATPLASTNFASFNNSTAGAKRGLKFTVPMDCRVCGVRFPTTSFSGDFNILLMDSSAAELSGSSTPIDGDYASGTGVFTYYFDNPVTLTAGETCLIGFEPTTATNISVVPFTLPSANYRSAFPGGAACSYFTYTTAGGVVDNTNQLIQMDVLLDQVDNGAGTGGVVGVIGG